MNFPRESGILLHPTSLPGQDGIGDFGSSSFRFVEWLERAGQHLWQVMPLGPTGFGYSPYSSMSAFAGNPMLVSLSWLKGDGVLREEDFADRPGFEEERIKWDDVNAWRSAKLRLAYQRLNEGASPLLAAAFEQWLPHAPQPIQDFALFISIKESLGGGWWLDWPLDIRRHEEAAVEAWSEKLASDIRFHLFVQYLFFRQWNELRTYANDRNIRIIGDIPIFVALDSADVWASQGEFNFDPNGQPTFVAGVPPDFFSASGQRWGNPTFNWEAMKANGYRWWVERIRATRELVDIIRIDHFRGFAAAWHVPNADDTAANGHWEIAPGGEVFSAVRRELGDIPIIVEDLGIITPDVVSLREILNFPGMNVLHFAFDNDATNAYLPHNHKRNSVTYTATHDNQTTVGWWADLDEASRNSVRHYLGHPVADPAWDLLRAAWASPSNTVIAPMQDILRLGDEARMNVPATVFGNWSWRLRADQLDVALANGLRDLTETYGRNPGHVADRGANPYDYTDPETGTVATTSW